MAQFVLFDVDGTVSDGLVNRFGGAGEARPGIYEMLEVLHLLEYDIHLWSAAGAGHARHVAETLKLPFIAGCHDKPPTREHDKLKEFGAWPALIVDDSQEWLDYFTAQIPTLKVRHAFEILHPEAMVA